MALFSGGRYLRAQLRAANLETWNVTRVPHTDHGHDDTTQRHRTIDEESADADADADAPLQFWCFDSDSDGEDIKAKFKAKIAEVETLLTDDERGQIIAEAMEIMQGLIAVVQELEAEAAEPRTGCVGNTNTDRSTIVTIPASVLGLVASFTWGIAEKLGYRHAAKAAVPLA